MRKRLVSCHDFVIFALVFVIACMQERGKERWYALRIYRNKVSPVLEVCESAGIKTYIPTHLVEKFVDGGVDYEDKPVIPGLMFVRATEEFVVDLKRTSANGVMPYCKPESNEPGPIDDRAMEIFMFVVRAGSTGRMEAVDMPIDKGDRIRVIGGVFKGAEGYIRRVHGSRRFVAVIEGIAAIAVTHIPREFIEKIETPVQVDI